MKNVGMYSFSLFLWLELQFGMVMHPISGRIAVATCGRSVGFCTSEEAC